MDSSGAASTVVEEASCDKTCIILISSGVLAFIVLCLVITLYYAVCKDKEKSFLRQSKFSEELYNYNKNTTKVTTTDNTNNTMSSNQRLAMQGRNISYIGDDASNVGYHSDGFDAYLVPSLNYSSSPSYMQNNQPVGSYDIPDSAFYYDDNVNVNLPKATATTLQSTSISPVDKLYDRFSFNNIEYNLPSSVNRSFAPNQPSYSNAVTYRSKRTVSQNGALDSQMYTIKESAAGHLKIPQAEQIERKTKSVPDLSHPSYNQSSNDYATKAKRKAIRSGPFSVATKKPMTTTSTTATQHQQHQQQQQQQHMYGNPISLPTNYGYMLPNDRYYHDDAYSQNISMEVYPTYNKHDVTKEEELPLEILPQQHYFSYMPEGQQHQYMYPEDTSSESKDYMPSYMEMQENSVNEIRQYVV